MVFFYKKKNSKVHSHFSSSRSKFLEHLLFDITAHEQSYESKDLRLAEHYILHPVPPTETQKYPQKVFG